MLKDDFGKKDTHKNGIWVKASDIKVSEYQRYLVQYM